jgi:hypothetical protein
LSKLQFDLSVAVGRPNRRSLVRRVFARAGAEDVYVTSPEFSSSLKASIDASGQCHLAFASAAEHEQASSDWSGEIALQAMPRHLASGRRERGGRFNRAWTAARQPPGLWMPLHIAVPSQDPTEMAPPRLPVSGVLWVAPGPLGTAVDVSIAITPEPLPSGEWPGSSSPGTIVIRKHQFQTGRTVWLLGLIRALTTVDEAWLTDCASVPIDASRKSGAESDDKHVPRIVLPCLQNGAIAFWDVERNRHARASRPGSK